MSTRAFEPTLLRSDPLCFRLSSELTTLSRDLQLFILALLKDPKQVSRQTLRGATDRLKLMILAPNVLPSCGIAILTVCSLILTVSFLERKVKIHPSSNTDSVDEDSPQVMTLLAPPTDAKNGFGVNGPGRVGVNRDKGEGSGPEAQRSGGGGSGGNGSLTPSSVGKLPSPSIIPAAIPTAPTFRNATLPVAGIDLDPALFRDVKFPVYGDPRSRSELASNGPGRDGGIGDNRGTGVGEGEDGGVGPGKLGNTGGDSRRSGCCGEGSSRATASCRGCIERPLRVSEVATRPRVISKPEPQYTEEARRNQMMGTVVLRVIFSNTGQVTQITAIKTLPYGLTESAIAAARRITFVPAMMDGNPVSVYMQLEYNFNLY